MAFDKVVALASAPDDPWELEIRDDLGSLGRLRFDGVHATYSGGLRGGSNTMFGYLEDQLRALASAPVMIVHWASTGEEDLRAYVAMAAALRRTWPAATLGDDARAQLAQRIAELAPALREEAYLPDWEFQGEHKLPIIPEPLGIISLSRSERRVDPLASLTAALAVVCVVIGLLTYFIARTPWVPGK